MSLRGHVGHGSRRSRLRPRPARDLMRACPTASRATALARTPRRGAGTDPRLHGAPERAVTAVGLRAAAAKRHRLRARLLRLDIAVEPRVGAALLRRRFFRLFIGVCARRRSLSVHFAPAQRPPASLRPRWTPKSGQYDQLDILQSIFRLAARRRPAGIGKAFTAPVTERWIGRKAPPRRWTSMGVALWADSTGGDLPGRYGQVGDRRRPAAMAAKVVVQPAARIPDAGRPPRRLGE